MALSNKKIYRSLFTLLQLLALLSLSPGRAFSATGSDATPAADPTAELLVHNRSGYPMTFALWKNAIACTEKMLLAPDFNINTPQGKTVAVPAKKYIAIGVAVLEVRDKLPLTCDYILSFKFSPSAKYMLEYDVHDRQCYAQMYQSVNGTYQLILPGEQGLHERIPIFGWDKSEPGCEEE